MGIKKLWTFLKKYHREGLVFQEIDLAEEARRKGATGERRAELWCDYGAVVRQLETALLKERQPKFCSYYGCDTRLLGQQMEAFIKALRSVHIEPVFVSDGPPGADEEGFQAKYAETKSRQEQRQRRSRDWEAEVVCPQHRPLANIPNPQCYVVCNAVLKELEVRNLVTHCEADTVLMHKCHTSPNALGILSSDTDIAVVETNCAFLPLDFFDHRAVMGFHKAAINDTIHSLPCRYTNRQLLAKFLSLRDEDMTMFAILCGNDYTDQYAYNIKQHLGIQRPMGPAEVAQWLNQNRPYAGRIEEHKRRNGGFRDACKLSTEFYSGKEPKDIDTQNISQLGILSPIFLSIKNGIFLQPIVVEVDSVGDPLPCTKSQPIRKALYALYGQTKVVEHGFLSYKAGDFGQASVANVKDLTNTRDFLRRHPLFTRAAALHHLISTPLQSLAEIGHAGLERNAPADLPPDEHEVLRGIIAVSAVAYLMPVKELRLDKDKVRACLLAFAATTAGVQGDVDIDHPETDPFLRAVSLSSTISVTLLSLYYIAELLDLSPKASDIFCSSVFVPAYMAVMRYLPAGIPALAPVVGVVHSPHTTALVGYIQTMQDFQDKPELSPPELLTSAVRSYTALVDEMKTLVQQEKQGPAPVAMPRQPRVAIR